MRMSDKCHNNNNNNTDNPLTTRHTDGGKNLGILVIYLAISVATELSKHPIQKGYEPCIPRTSPPWCNMHVSSKTLKISHSELFLDILSEWPTYVCTYYMVGTSLLLAKYFLPFILL